jgi:uncharacterized protein (DUF2336 family)
MSQEKIRLQVPASPETVRKIEELAELLGMTPAQMSARLLEQAVSSDEWVIKFISVPLDRVRKIIRGERARKDVSPG